MSLWLQDRAVRWPTPRLKDVAAVVNGFPFAADGFNDTVGLPVIRIRDLLRSRTETFFDGTCPASAIVDDGDLLVGMDGDFNSAIWGGGRAGLNQRMCKVVAGPAVDPSFLAYFIDLPLRAINEVTYFTTVKHLSSGDLMDEAIPTPPIAEQRVIADYLDAETVRIDALITKKGRLIDLLGQRELREIDRLFEPTASEPLVRLGRVARVQTGVTVSSNRVPGPDDVIVPYLRVANVQPGRLDLDEVKMISVPQPMATSSCLRLGDVLMTEGGDIDKLGRGTVWNGEILGCIHQNHVFAVRTDSERLLPAFLAQVSRSSHARAYFESTGVQSTNLASTSSSKVADFRLPLLPIAEQLRRCEAFDKVGASIGKLRNRLNRQIELLVEHRQALITAAVTGEFSAEGAPA